MTEGIGLNKTVKALSYIILEAGGYMCNMCFAMMDLTEITYRLIHTTNLLFCNFIARP